MWKIFVTYDDKSKLTLTGKQKEITLELATKYYNQHVAGRCCSAVYQQYPKKDHEKMDLWDKIEELREEMEEQQ